MAIMYQKSICCILHLLLCIWKSQAQNGATDKPTTNVPTLHPTLTETEKINFECEVNNCPNGERCLRRQGFNVTDYVCECEIRPRDEYGPTCEDTLIFFRSFNFFPCYGPKCSSGNFTSLNYPNNYKNRNLTMMLVYVPGALRFDFTFDKRAFQVEYGKDDLLVGRGLKPPIQEIPSQIPEKEAITSAHFFHGYNIPDDFSIESDTFFIYWATDSTVVFKGFSLLWTSVAIEVTCPRTMTVSLYANSSQRAVYWDLPTVKSGVGSENLIVRSNYKPGDIFGISRNTIQYIYEDDFGHREQCSFGLIVEGATDKPTTNIPTLQPTLTETEKINFESTTTSTIQSTPIFFLIVASLGLGTVFICVLGIIGYKMKRAAHLKRRKALPTTPTVKGPDSQLYYLIPHESNWKEFSRSKLKLLECIGSGEFGSVHRGKALGILQPDVEETVAVKRIKDNASITERIGFCLELEIYKALEVHPNIVPMLGFCTTSDPLCIILEYLSNGNLHKYLKKLLQFQGLEDTLANSLNLMMYALQIAKGMEYLASKNYVHGDLMAKNILLSSNFVCKLANFGRTREVTDNETLEVDTVELHSIRWTAPEKILDGICTKACDVWSFGVVIWELLTLGSYPYEGKSTKDMVASIDRGFLLPQPDYCEDEIYEMITKCLQRDPANRPNFSRLRSQLDEIMDKNKNYLQMEGSTEMAYNRQIYNAHSGFTDQSPKEENDYAHYYSIELTPMSTK